MRRGTVLVLVLVAVAAAAVGGWMAGRSIESPAEAAARAAPPEPSLITVAVEKTTLSADVIARGDIVFDDPVSVALSGATGDAGVTPVVTRIADEGSELAEGDVMVEVAGRPVFLLTGVIPVFRDPRPGTEGIDVLQLEEALARLGYMGETPDQQWTSATGAAIQAMYDAAGYRAVGADESELSALEGARERVVSAQRSVTEADRAINEVTGATKSEILAARAEVAAAEDTVELAVLTEDGVNDAAVRAHSESEARLADAETAATRAADRLARAEGGKHPDTGLPPTPEELTQLRQEDLEARQALGAAQTEEAAAAHTVKQTAAEQAAAVAQARAALDVAKARLDEVLKPPDRSGLSEAASAARRELADANEALADLQASVGTWLPAGEVVFLERVPVRVNALAATLGSTISGPFMTVSGSEITLRVQVQESDAATLEVGDAAIVDEAEVTLEGVIASIAEQANAGRIAVEVTLAEIPEELVGANVKVVIPIESTAGDVLAVPAAALSATADGSARVEVEDEPGKTRFVTVEPGLAAGGLVEITPLDGDIEAGARVVVGRAAVDDDG
ncbi:MAG: hypothetical protein OEW30_12740 [Acidimicrobiia bacterium]|nr:hypothetical protein [Acidimicrobiia bacterium]